MNSPDIVARFLVENQLVIHEMVQGSREWHAFRGRFYGASEAAAMLGLSKNVTRNELLRAKSTGVAREFSDFVQTRILDRGHELEASARPHVEALIDRGLYPATYSRGKLSYSSDGATAPGDLLFEHKQWNEELAASVRARILPDEHWPQCQQGLLVECAEKLIFVVSDGTPDRMVSMEVYPDHDKFAQLLSGWAQFEKDLAEYQHIEAAPEVVGRAPDQLPALRIEVTGMVTASNLAEFKEHAMTVIGSIRTELQTDEDFADADKAVKWCGEVEDRLEAAKQHALSQTASIDELFRTIDAIKEEARQKRLTLEKLVKARKDTIRVELVQAANTKFSDHIADLQSEIDGIRLSAFVAAPDFGGAIKGLKTISSLRNAIDTALANGKIAADSIAKDVRDKLAWMNEYWFNQGGNFQFLFADLQQIILKPLDDFKMVITHRIGIHKQTEANKLEAERLRIRQEEETRAQVAFDEAKAKADTERARANAVADWLEKFPGTDSEIKSLRSGTATPEEVGKFEAMAAELEQRALTESAQETVTMLKLGEINSRLGFTVSADFLAKIGFEAKTEKNAKLYRERDFLHICEAIIRHVQSVELPYKQPRKELQWL